ncbi:1-acyl-sn-glycerol-3-phosphate acyltransferase [Phytophthora nicotianae]|uniref:1-acyl-sn-glycerol-3-phosphate acyltransferase n=1 Tax=Phytophthora nicotianae TaxID=4792 RepID=A0A0W8D2W2_PHYNI|nr:1-acyl-sn-glycerol-3-phosphate acyltransferase [Phytophthora nicotianae]
MASTNKTVLITGSTRRIGLAFAKHYTKAGWNVIGTARANSNTESDETSILEAARQLEGQPIDLLINNAGIGIPSELETGTKDALMKQFELAAKTNGGASVMQLSSYLGSIGSYTTETTGFFKQAGYGYSSSKAALNMITRSLAFDLQPNGIVVVSVHPGYVDTDMTQGKATLKPEDSVMAMTSLIGKLNHESTGKFFNLDPQIPLVELPW